MGGNDFRQKQLNLGRYQIRDSDDDSDAPDVGAFYRRQRVEKENSPSYGSPSTFHATPPVIDSQPSKKFASAKDANSNIPTSRPIGSVNKNSNITQSSAGQPTQTSSIILDESLSSKGTTGSARHNVPLSRLADSSASVPSRSHTTSYHGSEVEDSITQLIPQSLNNTQDENTHESFVININPSSIISDDTTSKASQRTDTDSHTSEACSIPTGIRRFGLAAGQPQLKFLRKKVYPKHLPYHQILSHVKFVMSGYENPRRGKLRDMAIEMGASYAPSWDRFCTHLICAFKNTPKYKEVRAEDGRIVREHWIQECSRQRKLLDWRIYKLGKYPFADSDEEVDVDDLDYALKVGYGLTIGDKK